MTDQLPAKTWYRLAFDANGKLLAMRAADRQKKPGERIFYVLAADKESALAQGLELWKQYANARAAELLAARRAANEAQGLCRCGRPRDRQDLKKCAECRALDNEHNARHERRLKGEDIPKRDRRQVLKERKRRDELRVAAAAYESVLEAAQHHRTIGELSRWLRARLVKIDHELNGIRTPEGKVA